MIAPIDIAIAENQVLVLESLVNLVTTQTTMNVSIQAADGVELLRKLETARHLPDICVIDTGLPGIDGFIVQQEIKKRWPHLKTLAISSCASDLFIIRMIRYGASGYLTKNSNTLLFINALQTICDGGFFYSDAISRQFVNAIKNNHIKLPVFSGKELTFLALCCHDLTYQQIACKMGTTTASINGLRDSLFKKLDVKSRTGIVIFAIKYGLVQLENDINL